MAATPSSKSNPAPPVSKVLVFMIRNDRSHQSQIGERATASLISFGTRECAYVR
jgi:hypothetical protein